METAESAESQGFDLSVSSAGKPCVPRISGSLLVNTNFIQGNRFTVLQDTFTLADNVLGEDSDHESEEADADGTDVSMNVSEGWKGGKRSWG